MSPEEIKAEIYTSYSPTDHPATRRVFEAARERAYQALEIMIEINGLRGREAMAVEAAEYFYDLLESRPDGLRSALADLVG